MRLRRQRPPAEVRDLLPEGERLLAWASGPGLGADQRLWLAATTQGLNCTGDWFRLDADATRVGWDQVDTAAWDFPLLEMRVRPGSGGPGVVVRLHLDEPGEVPTVIYDRVVDSIMFQQHCPLPEADSDLGAKFVCRRGGADGRPTWQVVLDSGLDREDPQVKAAVAARLAELRATLGV